MKYLLLLLWLPVAAQTSDTAGWVQIKSIARNHTIDEWVRRGSPADLEFQAQLPRIIIHDTVYIKDSVFMCPVCGKAHKYHSSLDSTFRTWYGLDTDSVATFRSRRTTITTKKWANRRLVSSDTIRFSTISPMHWLPTKHHP